MATIKRVYMDRLIDSGKLKSFELVKQRQKCPLLRLIWRAGVENGSNKGVEIEQNLDVFSPVSLSLVTDEKKPLTIKAVINCPA